MKIAIAAPRLRAVAALAATASLVAACGGGSSDVAGDTGGAKAETTLTLVAYAVPEPGWSAIIPAFAATEEGKGVAVTTSYGASGDQSRAVVDGKPADIVNFSVEPDVTRLVKADKVDKDWNTDATQGIPFGSVVTLVVREGNPKNIKDWDDLLQPGIEVVTPSPLSSGSAKWNLLAPYAAKSNGGQDQQAGLDFVNKLVSEHIAGKYLVKECSMAKLWQTEMGSEVVDTCLQFFGGYGYMLEYPVTRAFMDARVQRIYAGTNEIMKVIVAKQLGL